MVMTVHVSVVNNVLYCIVMHHTAGEKWSIIPATDDWEEADS